jgi:anaerobic magnesium-protoporphyrin IX monomethyl ester cyclase
MKKVVLVYPEYSYPRKNPPMGLAYIASYLGEKSIPVIILDFNVDTHAAEKLNKILEEPDILYCGISFMTNQFGSALSISKYIKEKNPDIPVVVGGPHVSAIPEQSLEEMGAVDIVCFGEGEETAYLLAEALIHGGDLSEIYGIVYRKEGNVISNPPRELIPDINTLPFPAWDLLDLSSYSVFGGVHGEPTFALMSSRGCPSHCIFCDSHTIFSRHFRGRSAENMFSEIQFLHDSYGMVQFDFVDDLITVDKKRVLELCSLLQESPVQYTWMANARVNTVNEEMISAMKEAGCIRLDFGVESGDPEVRKLTRKGISDEKIIQAHTLAQKYGISTSTFLMVGNLGETLESVRMTARLMKPIAMDTNIAIACPFPGTELFQIAKKNGWIRINDWSKYVTSPTYLPGYVPAMVTDTMNQKEILNAYYFLHSFFVKRKFQARYGSFFLINPFFWKEWVFQASAEGGHFRKISMVWKLISAKIWSFFKRK